MTPYLKDIQKIYQEAIPWEQFRNCNILITGATGLIGSCLVDILVNHPNSSWKIYAIGRNKERASRLFRKYMHNNDFQFIQADIGKPLSTSIPFHFIIHAASNASPNYFVSIQLR